MRCVVAVIQPFTLDAVREALSAFGIQGLTVTQVVGHGRQGGHSETYRGAEYSVDLVPKVRLEVLVDDMEAGLVVDSVIEGARTGRIGDGKVWVVPVEDTVRIRTGERGLAAL